MRKVIVILGQTATGKSGLAVKIALRLCSGPSAKKNGGEIISADSRQIYKGLDIGTGKISKKEMRGIPHYLLDVMNPKNQFTVVQYKKLAEEKIKEIMERNKIPIICGGTGFYIDAVTKGLIFPEVPPNLKLRKNLEKKSVLELLKILEKLDSLRAKNIDIKNKVRLVRAIEIVKVLSKVPKITAALPQYKFIKIGLYLPLDILKNKIEKRVKQMFKNGLINEIKKLKKAGISNKRLRELGFEYFKPTYGKVVQETINYSKRQMTWFKKDKNIKWFSPLQFKEIENYIQKKL
ncbi:tRNA (adenosine(37)-N6)-dimethylallyltransferase MiaA [Candidatus Nomurabacteria bacterium RIFCSPHIGHO2_02_FULL_37_45]|uniref:tRNA dimethylallyltransferase n=2 Tax=Candidatus Nomuraibacteriota TaxID=1752729 RepID=A0A1F6Y4R9_9BACT|nr:MAG: tRNA (adenosine(37)-N6)-dimethylallyltransferase MiaA [Candidatus Nomurabacteria bacterium RIFCSPHIGHO2_01_FULL_37_110]OGI71473.1 MAG: tRNA (adenosine(37)-N6)-dimethylallyltransferase MiaA [Candidatus Nomurabacteria bacterium RIFCSPHIGHO2_02_FULL_37_45]OGI79449.1 MAG: tRNA (adenosine(37)-N6)-dimethylallyltransferase MiaA [Candidatus Nomurabacteria bacterium RIFCSPHIGHO2_12_FULL_37_29]OGI84653.1 MAG: tRNA (adenosine(37)-N6)-dimethylallyltransferase MiaA [Candidatus Nomurabacteria bacteriu